MKIFVVQELKNIRTPIFNEAGAAYVTLMEFLSKSDAERLIENLKSVHPEGDYRINELYTYSDKV